MIIIKLLAEIVKEKNIKVAFDKKRNEIVMHTPDPGEVIKQKERKALLLLKKLASQLKKMNKQLIKWEIDGIKFEALERESGVDAIRIYLT